MSGDNIKSSEDYMKTLKKIVNTYFCNLLTWLIGLLIPAVDEMNTEKYFHISHKEIRHELYGHLIMVSIDVAIAIIATMFPMLTLLVALPAAIFMIVTVLYLVFTLINIAQRIWMDKHPTKEEYVDPETGVTSTLMYYHKKRFI